MAKNMKKTVALILALVCLVAMAWFNTLIGLIFLGFMAAGFIYAEIAGHFHGQTKHFAGQVLPEALDISTGECQYF